MKQEEISLGAAASPAARTVQDSKAGLPERYQHEWRDAFDALVAPKLVAGARVLDVGSGRRPTFTPDRRPADCEYVGLDLSLVELAKAPAGSYARSYASDVTRRVPELEGYFDLIVSWQVLEHVKPLEQALENLRAYLKPGGTLVAQMSGTFSAFGIINRVTPQRLAKVAMERLLGREPSTVFPAYYDRCWYSALEQIMRPWSEHLIVPRYAGATYFAFLRPLQRMYVAGEDFIERNGYRNLATHYIVRGTR